MAIADPSRDDSIAEDREIIVPADSRATAKLAAIVTISLGLAALYFAKEILLPIALAILLSFLLAPMTARFERLRIGRTGAVLVVVGLAIVTAASIGWMVTNQIFELSRKLPDYKGNLVNRVRAVSSATSGSLKKASQTVEELGQELTKEPSPQESEYTVQDVAPVATESPSVSISIVPPAVVTPPVGPSANEEAIAVKVVAMPPSPLKQIREWLGPLVTPLTNAGLVGVLVVFILVKREDLRNRVIQLVGSSHIRLTTEALNDAAGRLSRYLRMQFFINACFGVSAGIGLYFLGVPNALLWGVLALLLRFLPYVGPWLAAAMPLALSLAVFDDWTRPAMAAALFIVLELVVSNVIEPLLYGASTGVSSLGIIVAAIFWTWLWGPVGLVLAMPLTVCLVVAGKYVPLLRFVTILFCDRSTIPLGEHIYQRLLALDEDEVVAVATAFLRTKSMEELYDTGFVPALYMAERDRHAGLLNAQQEEFVVHATRELIEDLEGESEKQKEAQATDSKKAEVAEPDDDATLRVLCIAVRDEADETAALMLARLLRGRGVVVQVLSARALASEIAERVSSEQVDVVVLSVMPPLGGRDGRYHCRRLRAQHPDMPILVVLWSGDDVENASPRFEAAGAARVVTTISDAIRAIEAYRTVPRIPNVAPAQSAAG